MKLKKLLTLAVLAVIGSLPAMAQDAYVALNKTNFPDDYFRTYLQAKFKSNLKTEGKVTYIDRTAVNTIDLNFADGKVNNTMVYYTKIKSLEGIKLFINLQTLSLPKPTYWKRAFSIGNIDVSGMPHLTTITNNTGHYNVSVPANSGGAVKEGSSYQPQSSFKMNMNRLVADDCPELVDVTLNGYSCLKSVSLEGSTTSSLESLFVVYTGLESLDVSRLTNLKNLPSMPSSSLDRYWTDHSGLTSAWDSMNIYYTFSVDYCENLTELILGEHNWKFLSLNYCDKLRSIDISGLTELVRFTATFHSTSTSSGTSYSLNDKTNKYSCNHQYNRKSGGSMERVIIGTGHKYLRVFNCSYAQLTNAGIDLENLPDFTQLINLSYNKLTSFDEMTRLKSLSYLDLGYNRIHHLELPAYKSISSLGLSDNCIASMDQFRPNANMPTYSSLARINPFQYIRVGKAYRYRVIDDAADAQYVETADDTQSQIYYWAIHGGHMGNPANDEKVFGGEPTGRKEDPCYFYFDSPLTDGQYWYRNPYTKNDHFNHNWFKVTLCHNQDFDFDPRYTFYLAGDFNNWQPTDEHAFVYNPERELYELQLGEDVELKGHFRIWNHKDVNKVTTDIGGLASENEKHPGENGHVFFTLGINHKVDTDPATHYTTHYHDKANNTVYNHGYKKPLVEMRLIPGDNSTNFVRIANGIPTEVEITEAGADADAPVELYDINGYRVTTDTPAPGIYIRKQGRKVAKVVIK